MAIPAVIVFFRPPLQYVVVVVSVANDGWTMHRETMRTSWYAAGAAELSIAIPSPPWPQLPARFLTLDMDSLQNLASQPPQFDDHNCDRVTEMPSATGSLIFDMVKYWIDTRPWSWLSRSQGCNDLTTGTRPVPSLPPLDPQAPNPSPFRRHHQAPLLSPPACWRLLGEGSPPLEPLRPLVDLAFS